METHIHTYTYTEACIHIYGKRQEKDLGVMPSEQVNFQVKTTFPGDCQKDQNPWGSIPL